MAVLAIIVPLGALLSGAALLLLGGGLLGTLLGVRGSLEGYGDQALGLIMSSYFMGFLLGTFLAPPAIRRMGHIRSFSFFAALHAATVLVHAVWVSPWGWGLLRFATGVAVVGLYTVIESWLNSTVDGAQRGRVFAVYMAINLVALALGQQLLRLAPVDSFVLFSLAAILVCAAVLPVAATRLGQPEFRESPRFGMRQLFGVAPAAVAGALFSGLSVGAFWGLGPVYAARLGLGLEQVATFMSATIIGGAVLQWPIGRLSDSSDRRTTLAAAALAAALVAGLAMLMNGAAANLLYAIFFVYGGLAFAIYPVAVAHLLDHIERERLVAACSTVLLVHGLGAALGPALAGLAMERFGPRALPGYLLLVHALVGAFAVARVLQRPREADRGGHFHAMLRTTPTVIEMLPEAAAGEQAAASEPAVRSPESDR